MLRIVSVMYRWTCIVRVPLGAKGVSVRRWFKSELVSRRVIFKILEDFEACT